MSVGPATWNEFDEAHWLLGQAKQSGNVERSVYFGTPMHATPNCQTCQIVNRWQMLHGLTGRLAQQQP